MKTFKGRPVIPGSCTAKAIVTHEGFNTLASFKNPLMFHDKKSKCSDHNNSELHGVPMAGKALCLPQTIGSTTGGMILYCAAALGQQPACMLFAHPIDSLAAAGVVLADVWTENSMPTVDSLGEEFLSYIKEGMSVTVSEDGTVSVE